MSDFLGKCSLPKLMQVERESLNQSIFIEEKKLLRNNKAQRGTRPRSLHREIQVHFQKPGSPDILNLFQNIANYEKFTNYFIEQVFHEHLILMVAQKESHRPISFMTIDIQILNAILEVDSQTSRKITHHNLVLFFFLNQQCKNQIRILLENLLIEHTILMGLRRKI